MKTMPSLFLLAVAALVNMVSRVDSISLMWPRHNTFRDDRPWYRSSQNIRRDAPPPPTSPFSSMSQLIEEPRQSRRVLYNQLYRILSEDPVLSEPASSYEEQASYEPKLVDFGFMNSGVPSFSTHVSDIVEDTNEPDVGDDDDEGDDVISPQTVSLIARLMEGQKP